VNQHNGKYLAEYHFYEIKNKKRLNGGYISLYMQPKITGINVYPLFQWVNVQPPGVIPTDHTICNVRCSTTCEVKFAHDIRHNLVCAGNAGGDFFNIYVMGKIVKKNGAISERVELDEYNLGKGKVCNDGSYRVVWEWPNRVAYREINATYEVNLMLLKRVNVGEKPSWKELQGPFTVKMLPPPPPFEVKPNK